MRSWHDFHIIGYAVDGKAKTLTFQLEWPYDTSTDICRAGIQFLGVECYYLEHDLGNNIVYGFEEVPVAQHLRRWMNHFEAECKWGWPSFWRPAPHPRRPPEVELEEATRQLTRNGVKCFELSSSLGLSGWILATEVLDGSGEV
mgnify:CR=1 FL=1